MTCFTQTCARRAAASLRHFHSASSIHMSALTSPFPRNAPSSTSFESPLV
jgi:hypothetical protein